MYASTTYEDARATLALSKVGDLPQVVVALNVATLWVEVAARPVGVALISAIEAALIELDAWANACQIRYAPKLSIADVREHEYTFDYKTPGSHRRTSASLKIGNQTITDLTGDASDSATVAVGARQAAVVTWGEFVLSNSVIRRFLDLVAIAKRAGP